MAEGIVVAVVVVVVRLGSGLLWFADCCGVGRASTTLRSILDQTLVGIPLSSSSHRVAMVLGKNLGRGEVGEVRPNAALLDPECVVGESVGGA